jgi:hypothetical protein
MSCDPPIWLNAEEDPMERARIAFTTTLLAALVATATACGRTSFGHGCEKAVELTAPWTDLKLPLDEKQARVCESSAQEVKIRSYAWTKPDEAQTAFEQALSAAGYAKDRCTGAACHYKKDGQTVSVHPMDFKVKNKKLVTLVVRMRDGR